MNDELRRVHVENLPLTSDNRLRVELVPMPAGDAPWRTQGEDRKEQRRDSVLYGISIAAFVVSLLSLIVAVFT